MRRISLILFDYHCGASQIPLAVLTIAFCKAKNRGISLFDVLSLYTSSAESASKKHTIIKFAKRIFTLDYFKKRNCFPLLIEECGKAVFKLTYIQCVFGLREIKRDGKGCAI